MVLKKKERNYFLPDEFDERLLRHRKNIYKRKLTIVATDDFLKQYDVLSDELKDKAIAVLSVLRTAKYPENYGMPLYDKDDKTLVKICGLKITLVHDSVLSSLVFYSIKADEENTNVLNLATNAGVGSMNPAQIKSEEFVASTIKLEDYGFNTLYEMEQYRQEHKMADIQEVLEFKGWKV